MSNPMRYIKDLEAAGFERKQAEAQVQMVLDAIEGDLVTKADFAVFQEQSKNQMSLFNQDIENQFATFKRDIENQFATFKQDIENQFAKFKQDIESQFTLFKQDIDSKLEKLELRLMIRLGMINVATMTIAVALLTWLIKV
jgi:hypothetical protein